MFAMQFAYVCFSLKISLDSVVLLEKDIFKIFALNSLSANQLTKTTNGYITPQKYTTTLKSLLLLLLIVIFYLNSVYGSNIFLQSPTITNWGVWGTFEKCPNGTYVNGMQLKVESQQPPLQDDTGLNGIRFFCSNLSDNSIQETKNTIQSTIGPWGTWRSPFFCNTGLVIGFQLRSETYQLRHDDTAANNLRVICSDGQTIEGEGTTWGEWTSERRCRKRQAVCGLQTQVEMAQGIHDDTSLNNLIVECCDIPNPSENCKPTDFWELVAECDNTNAFTPTTCSYERKIGLGYSASQSVPESISNNHEKSILENIGFSIGFEAKILSKKFQFETGIGEKTDYNWGASKTDTWNHETSTRVSFEVPPGVRSSMVQVVGTCGLYLVRTSKFQRVDSIGLSSEATKPIPLPTQVIP